MLAAARRSGNMLAVYAVFEQRTHSAFRNTTSEMMRRLLKRVAFPVELNQEDYSSYRVIHQRIRSPSAWTRSDCI